ncbi:hypothetical protein DL93DRAFT_2169377 [Clavulina sp. PMI_390]|nr:hypothetical protein DL93DRAFT_2169377 [Clavulina sp. PMI_390]
MSPIKQPPHSAGRRLVGLRTAIDPNQIPSVPEVSLEDQFVWSSQPFYTCDTQHTIPLSTSVYNTVDQGNSSPRFIRATTYAFPHSSDLASTCELPLAAIVQPFSRQRAEESAIPVVDPGPDGPLRCSECRGYVNPWTVWTLSGNHWVCNLCGTESMVPQNYFSPLDPNGRRVDLQNRPELRHGTVDFIVPKEYWAPKPAPNMDDSFIQSIPPSAERRKPDCLRTLFVIDVSMPSVACGAVGDICDSLRSLLCSDEPTRAGWRVGFLTFSSSLHFYEFSSDKTQPSILVVSDLDDVFCPVQADHAYVEPRSHRTEIEATLSLIKNQFADAYDDRRATFSAFSGALASLAESGGQVIAFTSELANYGPQPLPRRDEVSIVGTDKERHLFTSQNEAWSMLGTEFAERGIGVTLFALPNQPCDLSTLGTLSSVTGGDIFYHPRYQPPRDAPTLLSQLQQLFGRDTLYDIRIHTRVSSGLRVTGCYGSFVESVTEDLVIGSMDSEKSICINLAHDKQLDARKDVYLQCAVLYTSSIGQRRVRLLNLALGTASLAHNVYRFGDVHAVVTYFAKMAVHSTPSKGLMPIKEAFTDRCASLLLAYRRQCAASTLPTQLILPESLKLLPIYGLGILKDLSLRGGSISYDVRTCAAQKLRTMGVASTAEHLYPSMFAIHALDQDDARKHPSTGWIPLPIPTRPSYLFMESSGVYLIGKCFHCPNHALFVERVHYSDNNIISILWVGSAVTPELLQDLFGTTSIEAISPTSPLQPGSLVGSQVENILAVLENRRGGLKIPLRIARQDRDAIEIEFSNMLVEDQNNDAMSSTDYICHVHKLINTALNSNTSIGGYNFWTGW